jgi:hypothetical protein
LKNQQLLSAQAQLSSETEHQLTTDKEPNHIQMLNSKTHRHGRKKCSQTDPR